MAGYAASRGADRRAGWYDASVVTGSGALWGYDTEDEADDSAVDERSFFLSPGEASASDGAVWAAVFEQDLRSWERDTHESAFSQTCGMADAGTRISGARTALAPTLLTPDKAGSASHERAEASLAYETAPSLARHRAAPASAALHRPASVFDVAAYGYLHRAVATARAAPPLHVAKDALRADIQRAAQAGQAEGTIRKKESHVRDFVRFRRSIGRPDDDAVTRDDLLEYMTWYVLQKPNQQHPGEPHSVNTLSGILSAVREAARELGWGGIAVPNGWQLTASDERDLDLLRKGLAKVEPPMSYRKLPMKLAHLQRMWARPVAPGQEWARSRDRCWQGVGHQAMLRVSELLNLEVRDLEWVAGPTGAPRGLCLSLRNTKTAQFTQPGTRGIQHAYVARNSDATIDVVGPLWRHMCDNDLIGASGDPVPGREGWPIFCARQATPLARLSKLGITASLRADLVEAGIMDAAQVSLISGMSLRSGGATDLRDSGIPMETIIRQGRWRSDCWQRYVRQTDGMLSALGQLRADHTAPSVAGLRTGAAAAGALAGPDLARARAAAAGGGGGPAPTPAMAAPRPDNVVWTPRDGWVGKETGAHEVAERPHGCLAARFQVGDLVMRGVHPARVTRLVYYKGVMTPSYEVTGVPMGGERAGGRAVTTWKEVVGPALLSAWPTGRRRG